jgi:hypothetical protein
VLQRLDLRMRIADAIQDFGLRAGSLVEELCWRLSKAVRPPVRLYPTGVHVTEHTPEAEIQPTRIDPLHNWLSIYGGSRDETD